MITARTTQHQQYRVREAPLVGGQRPAGQHHRYRARRLLRCDRDQRAQRDGTTRRTPGIALLARLLLGDRFERSASAGATRINQAGTNPHLAAKLAGKGKQR